jgi:peptidoglycan/LPS O-acetylase OafA/YrhL
LKYRPEVDGLRAIAVVPVILFHADLPGFSGGFLGVDVFFVISGYLITTIIVSELETEGHFSLAHFYERRARRILPALGVTILMTLAIAPFTLTPGQIKDLGQSVFSTAVFVSNYFFYLEIDYFNPFASQAPLLHTWSLAVEEQFYLFFPLLLLATKRIGLRYRILFALVFSLSFASALWTTRFDPLLSFYSIHTRAWELAMGAGVALWLMRTGGAMNIPTSALRIMTSLALIALLISLTTFSKDLPHPGFATLIPVGATAVLVACMRPGGFVYRMLSSKISVHIGLMSYGLYLYHNPLFSFVEVYFDYLGEATRMYKLALIPFVYLIALASLHLLERPLRRGKRIGQTAILAVSAFGVLFVSGIGLFLHTQNGFQSQIAAFYAQQGMPLLVDVQAEKRKIDAVRAALPAADSPFGCSGGDCERILLIGDSFSDDAYLALASYSKRAEYRRVYFDDTCMGAIDRFEDLEQTTGCNGKEIRFSMLLRDADMIVITAKWQEHTYQDGYDLAVLLRAALEKRVVVVGAAMFSDLSSFSIKAWRSGIARDQLDHEFYVYQRWDRLRTSDKLKDMVVADPQLSWIGRDAFFCDRDQEVCQLLDQDEKPMIWDNAHLTTRAYESYARFIETQLGE